MLLGINYVLWQFISLRTQWLPACWAALTALLDCTICAIRINTFRILKEISIVHYFQLQLLLGLPVQLLHCFLLSRLPVDLVPVYIYCAILSTIISRGFVYKSKATSFISYSKVKCLPSMVFTCSSWLCYLCSLSSVSYHPGCLFCLL